ncbi:uncharacterized protein TRIVIDRAFT_220647 [Trichoderma virens Gv29-8]|uniref:Uncharacterized protein n=1 Tax=Hypocrea virens (strain Gv29-8 / FGSC 10586) TaxID=413071 RepID=G9MNB9_HYPVG|nr:uncharacterized protein TRIVIDRAFT_220647 [Trichoderma virens Gv29-8]EHK23375.1 hypothetical protein TRIVIDRAFT_220647 [Trichoderma virens Gv29-8]UKZ49676.1 hypothetical protein TrVGV298_003924 [Trichoderma virens]
MRSTGGEQRASEVNSAMLSVPGYADDTMLFMLRWGSTAQATLRKVDYDEFQVRVSAMNTHWFESQRKSQCTETSSVSVGTRGTDQGDGEPEAAAAAAAAAGEAEAASCDDDREGGGHTDDDAVDPHQAGDEATDKAAELRARTLELIQDFPHLVREFDKFVDCTRIMAAKYGKAPV